MSYTVNSRNRRFKQRFATTANRLSFHFFHLSNPKKIIFIGAVFAIVGLFVPWFSMTGSDSSTLSYNAFSILAGYIGYIIAIGVIILFFLLLSNKNKQAVKSRIGLGFSDNACLIGIGAIILLLSFSTFQSIRAYGIFLTQIEIGRAVVFEIMGGILVIAGTWWKFTRERAEAMRETYVENAGAREGSLEEYRAILDRLPADTVKQRSEEANMSLPF
ncbi:MAG TPA: hypothetical protein PK765_02110 [bacterium]|nr:hypothetical protein [bacterium]